MQTIKSHLCYFVLYCLFFPSIHYGQASAQLIQCQNLRAELESLTHPGSAILSAKLERELAQGVWTTIQTKTSQQHTLIFLGLTDGKYRVSYLLDTQNENHKTILHHKKQNKALREANVLISNPVTVKVERCRTARIKRKDIAPTTLTIFPNPSNGSINFKSNNTSNINGHIYDITGQLIQSFSIGTGQSFLSIELQVAGLYLVQWVDSNGTAQATKVTIIP